ncbi:sialidase family protein [Aureliella helgolandensis]|uniref:exo-alpha-sialidase n=1 Tax=Aureliella helgolandensis TaxID=2527968 RepID=A0A518GA39_9BACT|nr:sialidase family protein [Aureliella helgolandensis]QDV25457.1 Sialidase precursor [Aureliella helgolandensis]
MNRSLSWQRALTAAFTLVPVFAFVLAGALRANTADFEHAQAGPFQSLDTNLGKWVVVRGSARVDREHAANGKQCLHLAGGTETSIELTLAGAVRTDGNLTFRAERWTKRSPFTFRIEKRVDGQWLEIWNGDKQIQVGRGFLSDIDLALADPNLDRLRISVTSPPGTGVLIDDVRIAPAQVQRIVAAEVVPLTLPALVGVEHCPIVKLKIETSGRVSPISLSQIRGNLKGTILEDEITQVSAFFTGSSGRFNTAVALGSTERIDSSFQFDCGLELGEGANYVWIACGLRKDANIDHRIGAVCEQLTFSNGETIQLDAAPTVQRMGIALRSRGEDGVHTYRIPGLATTLSGSLISVYDNRRSKGGDLPGDIDVGMSRSTDGGLSWRPMRTIMDMGQDPEWNYDGIGDPAVLVDRNTGTIWVAATWSHGNRSWHGSGPGLQPEETGQLILVRSDDDGLTWSDPINITQQVKRPEWCFLLQGPGKGITMQDGTLVFAAQYQDSPENDRLPHSTILYSKDHGANWHIGTGAFDDTTEAQVVELEPGVLMLNCRYNRDSVRVVMTTNDMGKTWHKHASSERALIEPTACMASLINVDREVGANVGTWLLFSNPDSTRGRHHITIKASPDHGLTWPKEHHLLLDKGSGSGYSCMSMIDRHTVGILYEGSQAQLTFQRIPLKDLVPPLNL